jgi:hypothetical protein
MRRHDKKPLCPTHPWVPLDDLCPAEVKIVLRYTTPRRLDDGRLYVDLRELGTLGLPT